METHEQTKNSHSQNKFGSGITEEYITITSVEIEGWVTKKLSQELSRTVSRILGALSKLDGFPLDLQTWTLSGTVPGTSRNNDLENWEPTGDRSLSDPQHEMEFSARRSSSSTDSNPEEPSHKYFHSNMT